MSERDQLDLVTGAFSYTGGEIARRLLESGRRVRTLTFHPDREHELQGAVEAHAYSFDDPVALARSLEGVSTLYNTYWVRFDHGPTTFSDAMENSRALFAAARRAGVERIVHVSITNPSIGSPLPYFRGKALVERALAESGVPFSIVRPTWIFGGRQEILANNIAWILRHFPLFAIPGDGEYQVQPVHVDDLARLCIESSRAAGDVILDAAGPQAFPFKDLVQQIRTVVAGHGPVIHVPPLVMAIAARALGQLVRDVVLTPEEIAGLQAGLLVSHKPPLGTIRFTDWLAENADSLGRTYANELRRHYRRATA
jgi:NADH dehydrogenase